MRISDWSSDVCSSYRSGSRPGSRRQLYMTAHGLDIASDHIHADATAGNIGDFFGRGKTGRKNKLPKLFVGSALGYRHALRQGFFKDAFTAQDRTRHVEGRRVAVRVDLGGRRTIKKNKQ